MPEDPEFEVSSRPPAPPPVPPAEPVPDEREAEVDGGAEAPAVAIPPPSTAKLERPVDYPGGIPPVEISRAQLDDLQAAQARHAQHLAIEDLSRRHPAVRLLAEENAALKERIAVIEKGAKKKVR